MARKTDSTHASTQETPSGLKLLRTLNVGRGGVLSLKFNRNGSLLACGGSDGSGSLWRVDTGRLVYSVDGHRTRTWTVAFDNSGRLLASGSSDRTIKLWKVHNGKLVHTLSGSIVWDLAFAPDDQLLVNGSDDAVGIWD